MTNLELRSKLLARGHTLASWARANGYQSGTVQRVAWRAINQAESRRNGILTHRILADLSRDIGMVIVPGIAPSPPQSDPGRKAA
jgi:hypothetical protein